MARHIWTVLCRKATVDKETNQISLLEVVEDLEFKAQVPRDGPEIAGAIPIPFSTQLATLWTRSEESTPEACRARVSMHDPVGESAAPLEVNVDLQNFKNFRNIVGIPVLSVHRSGRYWLVVELEVGDAWQEVARVPINVTIEIQREESSDQVLSS